MNGFNHIITTLSNYWYLPMIFVFVGSLIYVALNSLLKHSPNSIQSDHSTETFSARNYMLWKSYHSPRFQQFLHSNQLIKINRLLQQSNWRSPNALLYLVFFKGALLLSLVGLLFLAVHNAWLSNQFFILMLAFGIFILAWHLPYFYLKHAKKNYQEKLRSGMHTLLELLIICTNVGYGFEQSFELLAKAFQHDLPELANELSLTAKELQLQPSRQQAWQSLINRTDFTEMHSLVRSLQQNETTGSPLRESLHGQAEHLRKIIISEAEERAAKIPPLMAIVVGLLFFPLVIVIVIVPLVIYFGYVLDGFL